jgi:hypothetical protein
MNTNDPTRKRERGRGREREEEENFSPLFREAAINPSNQFKE